MFTRTRTVLIGRCLIFLSLFATIFGPSTGQGISLSTSVPGERPRFRRHLKAVSFSLFLLAVGISATNGLKGWAAIPPASGPPTASQPQAKSGHPANVRAHGRLSTLPLPRGAADLPCLPGWSVVGDDLDNSYLYAVGVVSANDVWAVGQDNTTADALVEHWNGTAWSIVPSPSTGTNESYLEGIAVISSNDVWAVGFARDLSFVSRTLVEHWNGSAWNIVSSPNPGGNSNYFDSISAVSANDIWAVGSYGDVSTGPSFTLAEHWNGTAWSFVSSASPGAYTNVLFGSTAVSTNDVWAAGFYSATSSDPYHPVIEHWNGSAWTIVTSPAVPGSTLLTSMAAASSNDVWAVGRSQSMGLENTLIEHWNGSAWTIVPSPNGSGFNSLEGVAVASSNDVWAVGYRVDTAETGKTLMEHWNGSRWTLVNGPSIPTYSELDGIALGSNSMWAVGFSAYENAHTLTERLDGSAWTIVPSPNPVDLPGAASLNSVVVIAPDNIWVVGYYLNGNNKQTLAQVWDGTRWYTRSSPNASTHDNILTAVAVVSANEIWAVGFYVNDSGVTRTLTEQWNGSAWTIIPSPNQGAGGNVLSAVSANPANGNLRAVGHYVRAGGALEALSEHWTGSAWTLDPITLPTGGDNGFYGVEIAATNNIWEVGYFTDTSSGRVHTLIEHYDGSAWTIVPSPNQPGDNTLLAVTSLSATDIWAVGSYTNGTTRTLTEHWNGSAWTIVPSPNQGSGNNTLYAVAATSAIDVWAVGTSNNGTTQTLAERWDGSSWTLSTSPSPGSSHNSLAGAAASAGNIWSVGFYDSPGTQSLPLIELHSNCAPRPTFTPVPPTPCPITFSDVHPSDYFYIPVQYLACEGDISGYSDGTFRPFNNTTRGQLSKIVTLAEGWTLNTSGGPHFSDVTASNAFYGYIETAYNNGVISGYADGTFRPGNNVTRAQLSKIIVIAQHWPVDTTGGPHFTDVLTTDPFYTFIETAYNRGIISGYADGTFRPGNNATRGQIAKIVYSAVTSP